MTIDGISLAAVVQELATVLQQAKIEKIYQPSKDEVTLTLHTTKGRKRLLLCTSASEGRMHFFTGQKENPQKASNFCMVLRKYLSNGRIESIIQIGLDRAVHIVVSSKDELGVQATYTLCVELMGKYSNIILLNPEGRILDALRHVSFDTSSVRQILPQLPYALPPTDKVNVLTSDDVQLAQVLSGVDLPKGLVQKLQGFSPSAAGEAVWRHFGSEVSTALPLADVNAFICTLRKFVSEAIYKPVPCYQVDMESKPVFYASLPFHAYASEGRVCFDSMNEMLDNFYLQKEQIVAIKQEKQALQKILQRYITRVEKKLTIQLESVQGGQDADKYLLYGELISANIYQLKRGQNAATLLNYYTNEEVTVPLDPTLTPSQNATKMFKRASKMKTGATLAKERVVAAEQELSFLESLLYDIHNATTAEDLLDIRQELTRFGYVDAPQKQKQQKRSDPLSSPYEFISSSGNLILAGKNNRQNDVLTMRVAQDDDYWFHAKNTPGSHVILFTKGEEPADSDFIEAATIAAALSGAKDAGKVEVDYALRKNIWKPNGAKPGYVLFENNYSMNVSPDTKMLQKLSKKAEL